VRSGQLFSVDERSVAATKIFNDHLAFIHRDSAVMAANQITRRSEMSTFSSTNYKLWYTQFDFPTIVLAPNHSQNNLHTRLPPNSNPNYPSAVSGSLPLYIGSSSDETIC
jgi:hypothetical protein